MPHRTNTGAPPQRAQIIFKTLRTVDVSTLGTEPLKLTPPAPGAVHFANANGGLRMVDSSEVRTLAAASASRLIKAGMGVE